MIQLVTAATHFNALLISIEQVHSEPLVPHAFRIVNWPYVGVYRTSSSVRYPTGTPTESGRIRSQ